MLTVPTLAIPEAPRFIVVSASEVGQDIRFAFLSNSFPTDFATVVSSFANRMLLLVTGKRSDQVTRIEILPGGDLAIRQGEPINLSAVAYSVEGTPIGGLKFDWTVRDAGRNGPERPLPSGTFHAGQAGTFVITVRSQGFQAQANIAVEENRPLMAMRGIQTAIARGRTEYVERLRRERRFTSNTISSKSDYGEPVEAAPSNVQGNSEPDAEPSERLHGPNAGSGEAVHSASSAVVMRPPDEDGWGNNNWWLADDPGNQTGNPPGTSPDVGGGNGNFQLSAPFVALPGRGIDVALSLNYNSRVWSKSGSQMIFDSERGFPAPGWNLGFGKMMFMGTSGGCMIIDADGTQHGYTGTISNYNSSNYSSTNFNGHTADGTFIDYYCGVSTYNGVTTMSGSARLPNGTTVYYYAPSSNGKQAFPTQIADSQGNYITITYRNGKGPSIQTITDTLGRVITFNYDSLNRLISVDVPKLDNAGTRTAVRIHYKQITLNPGWAGGVTTDTNNWYPYVIDAIYYPGTGTGYWFDDVDSYSSYGMISKVVEQRGMSWSGAPGDQGTVTAGTMSKQAVYNYTLTPNYSLTDAPTYTTLTESWAGMDTAPAVTSYSVNNNDYRWDGYSNSPARSIAVTQPNGLISKQYSYRTPGSWTDGLIFYDETVQMVNSTPVVLASSLTGWQQGAYDSPRPYSAKVSDERGQTLTTTYTYSANYNQVASQKQYDYDGTTLLSETRNAYENNAAYTTRHIFNLVKSTEVYDGSGNRVSKTDYEYDNNAVVNGTANHNLKATPGVTMHQSTHDPYTTETTQVQVACLSWDPSNSDPPCSYEGESVWTWVPESGNGEGYYASCSCQYWQYEDVSVYDPNTVFRGNLTKTTVYENAALPTASGPISQTKQYDVTGNLVAESDSCCELKTYEYTVATQYAYPTTQTRGASDPNSPLKNTSSAVYDFYTGLIKQTTDVNGGTATTTYNLETLRPTQTTSSTGAYSLASYDELAMTVTDEVRESNGTLAGKTVTYLNGNGQVKKQESIGPNNVIDVVEIMYNQLGSEWKRSRPYRSGDTVYWSEKFYDVQGRLTKVVEPDGSETKASYNENLYPDSALVNGNPTPGSTIRVMDAWGRERWGRYDALGRLVEVVEPNPDQSLNPSGRLFDDQGARINGSLITKYSFDTLGRLTQTEQGGQLRKFKYDSLGRLIRQKLAEQSATLNDSGQFVGAGQSGATWSEAFVYDNRSNLVQKTDPRGVRINFSYQNGGIADPLNRIQSRSYDASGPLQPGLTIHTAPSVTYEYTTAGDKSRIKKITTTGVLTEDYTYDSESRVSEYKQTVAGRESYPLTTNYLYDTLDRVKEVQYPAQYGSTGSPRKIVAHSYDSASRLTQLTYAGAVQASNIDYNASDQTTSVKVGAAGTNQVTEEYTFDSQTGLLTNHKAIRNSQELLNLSYEYNRNGSVGSLNGKTGHLTKVIDNLNTNKNREYEFDALGRLSKAKGGQNGSLWYQTYSYDRFGNRTNVAASGVAADSSPIPLDGIPNLSYDNATNRITTAGYEYDVAGNQTRGKSEDGSWIRYEYDAGNRLSVVKREDQTPIQTFQYGSTNARLSSLDHIANQLTLYASTGSTVLAEYTEFATNLPTWTKSYTHLGDKLLSIISPNGQGGEFVDFSHPDRLGTRLITNGANSYEQVTLPFGTALNAETTGSISRRFTSYDRSSVTGLDYAVNRTYDSKLGRFTQVDPINMGSVEPMNPQSLNLYAYCGNDPINNLDPDGLFFGKLFKWIWKGIKKALKWIAVAISVAIAVVTIIYAPIFFATSLKLIFGIIAAVANAASTVLNAFGLTRAGAVFGIIAGFASFGTSLLAARSALNWKTFFAAVSSAATATSRTLGYLGHSKLSRVFGLIASATGFVSDGIRADPVRDHNGNIIGYNHHWDSSKWKLYKFIRSSAEQIASIAGASRLAGYLNVAGIADDVGDAISAYRALKDDLRRIGRGQAGQRLGPPDSVERLDFWKNTRTALTGNDLANAQGIIFMRNFLREMGQQVGRYNSIIGRVERGAALAR